MIFFVPDPDMRREIRKFFLETYAMKYTIVDVTTKRETRVMVIRCNMSSPPRRSNFPKSLDPGTIESPDPFAWSITMTMMRIERTNRRVERTERIVIMNYEL